jgi:hypothetical protein
VPACSCDCDREERTKKPSAASTHARRG